MEKHIGHREIKNTSQGIILLAAALMLMLQVCGFLRKEQITFRIPEDVQNETQTEELLASMSMEQKIYQMFIVTPEALTDGANVTTADETMHIGLATRPIGGLVYFSGNLINPKQTQDMLQQTQQYAMDIEGVPLFLCVDEEGGKVARIGNKRGFDVPKVGPMGNVKSKKDAYEAGNKIGTYLSELGFNLDFAPDADVLTNQNNSVIGNRSFGRDAGMVLCYASAYADGLHDNGILSTFKHFPGHGATKSDTHEGFAYTDKTYEELLQAELIPFAGAEAAGVDFVMVSHISVPNVTGDDMPCSLSYKMVTEILRGDLGYEGIIVTDAMNMGAIAGKYASDEAAVMAINAGVDMILMPKDFNQAVEGVQSAVECGMIRKERIDESVRRILKVKYAMR